MKIKKFVLILFFILFFSQMIIAESAYGDEIQREGYVVSRSKVDRSVEVGTLFQDFIIVNNLRNEPITATFSSSGNVIDLIEFESSGIEIFPKNRTL